MYEIIGEMSTLEKPEARRFCPCRPRPPPQRPEKWPMTKIIVWKYGCLPVSC